MTIFGGEAVMGIGPRRDAPNVHRGGMLAALGHAGFRRFLAAQAVSNIGTWVQITVENWLVLELSHSGLALGVTNALQFGPSVFLGLYGGVIADRYDRRHLLMVTQSCLGLLALAVGLLVWAGVIHVWIIWLAAGALGIVKCFDLPALQSFASDMVEPESLPKAVAWTNAASATGRTAGPVVGGLVLTIFGAAPGFLINAATFALVVAVLVRLPLGAPPWTPAPREAGQVGEGLRYVWADPVLAAVAVVMIVVFAAAYNFQISLALIASNILAGDSRMYGGLMSALGLGAVTGSLILARYAWTGLPIVVGAACGLAATQTAVAGAWSPGPLLAAVFAYGVSAGLFSVVTISTLQSRAPEGMRGRVTAFWSLCFLAGSPVGGPAFGALAAWIGVSGALRVEACFCAAAALAGAIVWRARRRSVRVA